VIFTKSAIRVYESRGKAVSTYGKPLLALPLNAVVKIERIKFDVADDSRMNKVDPSTNQLNRNMFEILLKDDFLPVFTHLQYTKMFKESSMVMESSPNKRNSRAMNGGSKNGSPS
jgi:hypothetical protein